MQRKSRHDRHQDQQRRAALREEVRTDISAGLPYFADSDAMWEQSKVAEDADEWCRRNR